MIAKFSAEPTPRPPETTLEALCRSGRSLDPCASSTKRVWFGSSTVDTLVLEGDEPLAPRRTHPGAVGEFGRVQGLPHEAPRRSNPPSSNPARFVQPRDVVYRSSTRTLLVASEGLSTVTELDALSVDPSLGWVESYYLSSQDRLGHSLSLAPQGIALSADERTLWFFGRGTYDVGEIALSGEVRAVAHAGLRLKEAAKLGFTQAWAPAGKDPPGKAMRQESFASLGALVDHILGRR